LLLKIILQFKLLLHKLMKKVLQLVNQLKLQSVVK